MCENGKGAYEKYCLAKKKKNLDDYLHPTNTTQLYLSR